MGRLDDRLKALEGRFPDEAARGPSEAFTHLRAVLDELAALRRSRASGDLLELAVSSAVEAGRVPSERADAYLEFVRDVRERRA